MPHSSDKVVSLTHIASFINDSGRDSEILAFDGLLSPADMHHKALRVDALIIFLCLEGSGTMSIDLEEFDIRPGALVVIHPHNYISVITGSPDMRCKMIGCSIKTMESILPKLTDILPVLVYNRARPVTTLSPERFSRLEHIISLVKATLDGPSTRFRKQKLLTLLQTALYEVMDLDLDESHTEWSVSNRKGEIMAKFILAVAAECRSHRKVEYYADRLCITSKHLSAVVKEITGKTASRIIDGFVALEARMLLRNTDLTVQEISSMLNFPNQSFFGKYFKHATGFSPTEYRSQRL